MTQQLITNNDEIAYREEVNVVSGKQPLTQHQQNKGDGSGLQETVAGAPPYPPRVHAHACVQHNHHVCRRHNSSGLYSHQRRDYREEVRALGVWCQENNISLNVNKTKEMIVDFRKQQRERSTPLSTSKGQQWRRWTFLSSSAYTSQTS